MFSAASVTQAGTSLGLPSTSTRHKRQAAASDSPSRWHSVGIQTPASPAAWSKVSPARLVTGLPSMVSVLTAMLASLRDLGVVLVAEMLQAAEDRIRGRLP